MRPIGKQFVLICLISISVSLHADPQFSPLGDLPDGEFRSGATSVSSDGSVIVGDASVTLEQQAFKWDSENGMVGLGYFQEYESVSYAYDVSRDGSLVIGTMYKEPGPKGLRIFLWDEESGMIDLLGDEYPARYPGPAIGEKTIAGTLMSEEGTRGFYWQSDSGIVLLEDPVQETRFSSAADISEDGRKIVGRITAGGDSQIMCIWSVPDGYQKIGKMPDWAATIPNAISGDGTVIVGVLQNNAPGGSGGIWPGPASKAFRWNEHDGIVELDYPPGEGFSSAATSVSGDGKIIVGRQYFESGNLAVMWSNDNDYYPVLLNDLVDGSGIDREGFQIRYADAISNDGTTIVGSGINQNGDNEAYVLTLNTSLGYPISTLEAELNTGEWMGWINVKHAPYFWSYSLNGWFYMEENSSNPPGAWGFFIK